MHHSQDTRTINGEVRPGCQTTLRYQKNQLLDTCHNVWPFLFPAAIFQENCKVQLPM